MHNLCFISCNLKHLIWPYWINIRPLHVLEKQFSQSFIPLKFRDIPEKVKSYFETHRYDHLVQQIWEEDFSWKCARSKARNRLLLCQCGDVLEWKNNFDFEYCNNHWYMHSNHFINQNHESKKSACEASEMKLFKLMKLSFNKILLKSQQKTRLEWPGFHILSILKSLL